MVLRARFGAIAVLAVSLALPVVWPARASGCSQATPGLKRSDALDCPSKHAWDLFITLSHPAADPAKGRGVPDLSKPFGSPGTFVVWETWRLSGSEVFLADGSRPPDDFNDLRLIGNPIFGKVPEPSKSMLVGKSHARPLGEPQIAFDEGDGIFKGVGGFGESRMNKATYDFVLKERLYNLNGQQQYARDVLSGKREIISFPVDSIEVKAAWILLDAEALAAGKDKIYYTAESKNRKYGLTALHIITKDIPNWFWATFHHEDEPAKDFPPGVETPDVLGPPAVVKGTVWEHYKLGGTQIDFANNIGQPTMLSDAYIEATFTKSSCISCHARATASPIDDPTDNGLRQKALVGTPNPTDFRTADGKVGYVPLDFLFSLPFRANPEQKQQ